MGIELSTPTPLAVIIILLVIAIAAPLVDAIQNPGRRNLSKKTMFITAITLGLTLGFGGYNILLDRSNINDLKDHYELSSLKLVKNESQSVYVPRSGDSVQVNAVREDGTVFKDATLRSEDGRLYLLISEDPTPPKLVEAPN